MILSALCCFNDFEFHSQHIAEKEIYAAFIVVTFMSDFTTTAVYQETYCVYLKNEKNETLPKHYTCTVTSIGFNFM